MKFSILATFFAMLGVLQQTAAHILHSHKAHAECDLWAREHGECVNNPRFMWTACLGSCIQFAHNVNPSCDAWAHEGECTHNPGFMHINCPRSCGMAIVWSPWVRNRLDLEHVALDPVIGHDRVDYPKDLFQAAELMRDRLVKYFEGLYPVVAGFSATAPTEFLGMMGITEAVLYVLRLHEVIYRQIGTSNQIDLHYNTMKVILDSLRHDMSSDKLMLQLPLWIAQINESAIVVATLLHELHHIVGLQEADTTGQIASTFNYNDTVSFHRLADYYTTRAGPISSSLDPSSTFISLHNLVAMPRIGLGTWQLNGEACYEAVLTALRNGYRMLDTAEAYGNEADIGRALATAIAEEVVQRRDVFVATKVSDDAHMGYEVVKELVQQQLARLQVDYIDLYFLHAPLADKAIQRETWRALEELYHAGTIRALGVSNFAHADLLDLLEHCSVKPAVLQNKYDVYHVGKQLDSVGDAVLQLADAHKVVVMAYSPFSSFPFVLQPVSDPIVAAIAAQKTEEWGVKVTPAQVLLKWTLQHGAVAIPRSADSQRQQQSLQVLQLPALSEEDMKILDILQLLVSSPLSVPVLHEPHGESPSDEAKVTTDDANASEL